MESTMNPGGSTSSLGEKLPDTATVDRAAQKAHEAIDRVAAKAGPAVEKLRSAAFGAGGSLQSRADQWAEMEDRWMENARSYVRENPLTAIGVAVVAGMVLSRLTR